MIKTENRTYKGVGKALVWLFSLVSSCFASAGLADDFVNPYVDIAVSEAVSNQVKTLTWCSLGTSVSDFNDDPIPGRTQGYQFYTMDLLDWSHDKLVNVGHSGKTAEVPQDFPSDPCDIYSVEFGVNDWCVGRIVGTIDDYENYKYQNGVRWYLFASVYRHIIETIRAKNPNAVIVLTTPRKAYGTSDSVATAMFPPSCDGLSLASSMTMDFYNPADNTLDNREQTRLADYVALIRQIAERENLVLCDWYEYAANQENLADLSVDTAVHPNDEGYKIMAKMLAPKILAALDGAGFCRHGQTRTVAAVTAGCEQDGCTAGTYCDECHMMIEGGVKIPAPGHDYVGVVTKPATTTLPGVRTYTCSRCSDSYTEEIPVVGSVVCLRNVSGVVEAGRDLSLPTTVKGLDGIGRVVSDIAVTWPSGSVSFGTPGVYTVSGHATTDRTLSVNASIRVVKLDRQYSNVSPAATADTTDPQPNMTYLKLLTSADAPAESAVDWATSNRRAGDLVNTLTWSAEVAISKVRICYSGNHKAPTSYSFSADLSGSPEIAFTASEVEAVGVHRWVEFEFARPVALTTLRCFIGGLSDWVVVERIWAFAPNGQEPEPEVEPNVTAVLSEVKIDGVTFSGFSPNVHDYVVQGEAITAVAADNAAVTVLPKVDDTIRIVTLSEDGRSTLTYVFETPLVKYLRNIAVPASRGQAPLLPTEVKGLSAKGQLLSDVPVVWEEVAPPATDKRYVVQGHAAADSKLTVMASVRVVEPSGEDGSSENVALNINGGEATMVIMDTTPEVRTKEQVYLNNGVAAVVPDWGIRAPSRPDSGKTNCDTEITLRFAKTEQIAKACVYYELDGSNYGLPTGVIFRDEGGNDISYAEPVVTVISEKVQKYEYVFLTPKILGTLKIVLENHPGSSRYISLLETEAWSSGEVVADLTPLTGASPAMLRVDGIAQPGYDPEVLAYRVRTGVVTADFGTGANANMGVTVLPRLGQLTRVVTLSEDGQATRTYELTSLPGLVIFIR